MIGIIGFSLLMLGAGSADSCGNAWYISAGLFLVGLLLIRVSYTKEM